MNSGDLTVPVSEPMPLSASTLILKTDRSAAGLEESSVCRLFRRYQDTNPYQYLLRRKMNLAAA
ncbi:MAG TPA: hypothetical protein VIO38_11930, partial [Rariglobus sp.]